MYAYIKGRLAARDTDAIIMEAGGIGYRIFTAESLIPRFGELESETICHTHMVVREDDISLYGFPTRDSVQMFRLLLGVSGIGPKVATQVMGTLNPDQFALAVLSEDIKTITTVKGLGKKGAERLILELRDKFKGITWKQGAAEPAESAAGSSDPSDPRGEIMSALLVLGFSSQEALNLVRQSYDPDQTLQENIRRALKAVGR